MTTNRAKLSTGTYNLKEMFVALRNTIQDLKHVDRQRPKSPFGTSLVQMAEVCVVQSSDNVRITSQGDCSLKHLAPEDFLHTKST
jgi:hypothetical protein